jgi:hypothetical protein
MTFVVYNYSVVDRLWEGVRGVIVSLFVPPGGVKLILPSHNKTHDTHRIQKNSHKKIKNQNPKGTFSQSSRKDEDQCVSWIFL